MADHSDEELLAMLQPLSMDFENPLTTNADALDKTNGAHLPGAAPPAPIAPAAPMAPMAPMMNSVANATKDPIQSAEMEIDSAKAILDSVDGVENGVEDSPQSQHIDQKKVEEEDEDQIAYEPIKTSRTPRSTRSKANASGSKRSLWPAESPNNKRPSRMSARKRRLPSKSKSPEPSIPPKKHDLPAAPNSPATSKSSRLSDPFESMIIPSPETHAKTTAKLNFEVIIDPLPPALAQQYTPIAPGDEIYRVLEKIPTGVPGETWLSVEFEDGRIDQVSLQKFWMLGFFSSNSGGAPATDDRFGIIPSSLWHHTRLGSHCSISSPS